MAKMWLLCYSPHKNNKRMHSSRMRTAHSSSHHGGVSTPPSLPDPPQLPPWLWVWTRSHSNSPLTVGLDQIPLNFLLGCGPGDPPRPGIPLPGPGTPPGAGTPRDQTPPRAGTPQDQAPPDQAPPPVNRIRDACENVTLPQLHCGR